MMPLREQGGTQAAIVTCASLPFEFGEGRRGVAGIILLEQLPAILFRLSGALGSRGEGHTAFDQSADVPSQTLEISPLVLKRAGQVADCSPVARNEPLRREAPQFVHRRQPSQNLSVEHGHML